MCNECRDFSCPLGENLFNSCFFLYIFFFFSKQNRLSELTEEKSDVMMQKEADVEELKFQVSSECK